MAHTSASTVVPTTPDKAWALLSDLNRFEEWMTMHEKWRSDLPEQVTVGSTMTEQLGVMGMNNVIEWTVEQYDAPNSMKISGIGMAGAKISFTLGVRAQGTESEVRVDADFSGQMVVGAIAKALEKSTNTELEESLEKLKGLAS